MEQQSGTRRLWIALRVLGVVALILWFFVVMQVRFHDAFHEYSVHGDQHQSIGHFWRYARDGAIPPGHLLSDYAFAYHAPPFWWAIMATVSALVGPLTASKVLGLVAYALYAFMVVVVVGRRSDVLLGCLVAILVLRNPPDMPEQITGGMARSMAPALLHLFLLAFAERRHKLALVALVLQAGTYPAIVIPCALTYGAHCLIVGPHAVRLRRCAGMFVAGLLILVLGKAQDLSTPSWWGAPVTYEEAKSMPAWGPGGRFPEVPHRSFESLMDHNLPRSLKSLGPRPVSQRTSKFVERHVVLLLVVIPAAIGVVLFASGRARRLWRWLQMRPLDDDDRDRFPWVFLWTFLGALAAYALVRTVAFKLFLPSRQLGFSVQYLVVAGLPLLVWSGVLSWFPRRRALALVVATLVTVVPAFVLRGDGIAITGAGYRWHKQDEALYQAVRKLPLDEEVGCDLYYCDFVMPLGQHVPFAAKTLSHPLRKGYYDEAERRLVEMARVLYATSQDEIARFVEHEHVRYFVYDKKRAGKLETNVYRPAADRVRKIFQAGEGSPRLLADPPPAAIVFKDGDRLVVDLSKLGAAP